MEVFIGTILPFAFNFAPVNWAFCQGQTLPISSNQALFALIGTTYGGNGTTTFQLPNLQGRTLVCMGTGQGLSPINIGEFAGANTASVTINNLPSHTHIATFTPSGGGSAPTVTIQGSSAVGNSTSPTGNYLGGVASGAVTGKGDLFVNNPASGTLGNIAGVTVTGGSSGGGTVTNALTGNSQPVSIQNPYLGINYCIALFGLFPSRN